MRAYDATCPYCGHRNNDMYLEETEGWMPTGRKLHCIRGRPSRSFHLSEIGG